MQKSNGKTRLSCLFSGCKEKKVREKILLSGTRNFFSSCQTTCCTLHIHIGIFFWILLFKRAIFHLSLLGRLILCKLDTPPLNSFRTLLSADNKLCKKAVFRAIESFSIYIRHVCELIQAENQVTRVSEIKLSCHELFYSLALV